ncbi:hypothetical protein KY328_04010 [Candidatus Woesearchaeota archaeon]|nr:hypothetical protein [Candidatus Woesearchaeota archaeon]
MLEQESFFSDLEDVIAKLPFPMSQDMKLAALGQGQAIYRDREFLLYFFDISNQANEFRFVRSMGIFPRQTDKRHVEELMEHGVAEDDYVSIGWYITRERLLDS